MTERTYPTADDCDFSPYAWPGGYPVAYYPYQHPGDAPSGYLVGDVLCADCAKAEWAADPNARFYPQFEEEALERDIMCDNCHTIIVPQQCRLCFDSIHEPRWNRRTDPQLPIFHGDYYVAHGECIAKAIAQVPKPYDDPKPTKVGKQAYLVPAAGHQIMTARRN